MFLVCDIYNEIDSSSIRDFVYDSEYSADYYYNNSDNHKTLFTGSNYLDNIKVEVFDTSDSVKEWYYVSDLLRLFKLQKDLHIEGFDYISHSPSTILRVYIFMSGISKDYMKNIAKYKILGLTIKVGGSIKEIHSSFIKKGVLEIPDIATNFDYFLCRYNDFSSVKTLILPSAINKNSLINFLINNDFCDNLELVFRGDMCVTSTLIKLLSFHKPFITVMGKLDISNIDSSIYSIVTKSCYTFDEICIKDNKYIYEITISNRKYKVKEI